MGNECPMSVRSPFYLLRMEHRIEGEERDRTEWEGEGQGDVLRCPSARSSEGNR